MRREIAVIPNFLDCALFRRVDVPELRRRFSRSDEAEGRDPRVELPAGQAHRRGRGSLRAHLPRKSLRGCCSSATARSWGRSTGSAASSASRDRVDAVGAQEEVIPLLSAADVFLLPSAQESFGLAALEAMACEVPVVASNVGGLPEVIEHGVTGFLHAPADLDGMAASAVSVLSDPSLHQRIASAGRESVCQRFSADRIVPMYEEYSSPCFCAECPESGPCCSVRTGARFEWCLLVVLPFLPFPCRSGTSGCR